MSDGPRSPLRSWNVCVAHTPQHAGLYRGIEDFRRGLDGRILSFDDGRQASPTADDRGSLVHVPCSGTLLHRRCHILSQAAAREAGRAVADADLLIAHSMFRAHCGWTRDWALCHRRPYWAVPHGCLDPQGMARRGVWKRLWMWRQGSAFLADADRVIFATQRELDKARPWLPAGQRGNQTAVVHWPVALPDLADRSRARTDVRQRLGIGNDQRILLFVGRLHSTKRVLETVDAFCTADPAGCHLAVVGMDGDLTAAQVAAATPAAYGQRVHVVGELAGATLADMWLAADGYISLSMKENFGYSCAEALAYGLPVILSQGHDLAAELPLGNGQLACGWLLPDGQRSTAIQAITQWNEMFGRSDAAAARGRAMQMTGRSWAAENLSFERFQEQLSALASGLDDRGGRRP
jgi:glycosyltransferase involved in cell wall biosynthesis